MIVRVLKGPAPNHQVEELYDLELLQIEDLDSQNAGWVALRREEDAKTRCVLQFHGSNESREWIALIQPLIHRNQRNRGTWYHSPPPGRTAIHLTWLDRLLVEWTL